jgi:hypothetical protein
MFKRAFFAVVAVSIVWSIVDFVIHGIILGNAYQETATLWRPMEQMKHGVLFGVAVGVPMGYGTYAVMPLPPRMALFWLLGSLMKATVGGALVGFIVKLTTAAEQT